MTDPRPRPDAAKDRTASLEDLVERFAARREADPGYSVEAFIAAHPRHAEELAWILTEFEHEERRAEATRPEADAPQGVGERIGPWRLLERVAAGGGGVVWRARHEKEGFVVALKILERGQVIDERDFARFKGEAVVLRELDIVNVAPVIDTGETEAALWIAFRWIEGSTLARLATEVPARDHPLHPFTERARLFARIARVFESVHALGILHRDIKPTNVMVDRLGEPMVIDFGIARSPVVADLTRTMDATLGTPRYLAPEALESGNRVLGPRSEVYGLGLCLHEFVTGRRPFEEAQGPELFGAIRAGRLPRAGKLVPRLPVDLEAIITRATHVDPRARHPTMAALAEDLGAFAAGRRITAGTRLHASRVGRGLESLRRHPVLAMFGLLLLVAAVAFGVSKAREERRVAAALETLDRWCWAPGELYPRGDAEVARALESLRPHLEDRPEAQFTAAWITHLEGRYEQALEILRQPRKGEEGRDHRVLLRAWLTQLSEAVHDPGVDGVARFITSHPDGPDVTVEQRAAETVAARDWSDAAEGLRRRLCPPSLAKVEAWLDTPEIQALDGPRCDLLRGAFLFAALPTRLGDARREEVFGRIERLLAPSDQAPLAAPWVAWRRGLLAFLEGRPESALEEIRRLGRARPEVPHAAYLEAVLLEDLSAPRDEVATAYGRAWDAFLVWRDREDSLPGASALEAMALRHLVGHRTLFLIESARLHEAEAFLRTSREHVVPVGEDRGAWMGEALAGVLKARLHAARADLDGARAALRELRRRCGSRIATLAINEEVAILRALKASPGEVRAVETEIDEIEPRPPVRLEPWLASHAHGLRPYARSSVLVKAHPRGR